MIHIRGIFHELKTIQFEWCVTSWRFMKNPVQFHIIRHFSIIAILAKVVCFKKFILIEIFSPKKSDALWLLQKLRKKLNNTKSNFNFWSFSWVIPDEFWREFQLEKQPTSPMTPIENCPISHYNFKVISLNGVYSKVNKEYIQGRRNFWNLGGNKSFNVISVIV